MEEGSTEIGLVISTFFVFIMILLPLNLFIQEMNYYNHINQKVSMATEIACFDTVLSLDSEALSQALLHMDQNILEPFEAKVKEELPSWIEPNNLVVWLNSSRKPSCLSVNFNYPYVTQYLFAGHLEKNVYVKLDFELPIDN